MTNPMGSDLSADGISSIPMGSGDCRVRICEFVDAQGRGKNRPEPIIPLFGGLLVKIKLFLSCAAMLLAFRASTTFSGTVRLSGSVRGRMTDSETGAPLAGGHVVCAGTGFGTVTDDNGGYEISPVPVGGYSIRMSYIGYETRTITDVIVKSERMTFVDGALFPSAVKGRAVEVTAGYFTREDDRSAATVRFNYEEIRRAPGASGDVSRILMSLPSVAKVNDQSNGLIVRGGNPVENAFYIDGIEVPNINHFPDQASSGGPIGMINVDLIKDVAFHSGAFPAVYGDRMSSVMDISLRDGNRREFNAQIGLNFTGFGGTAEGPLARGRGAWLVSARRSYLDYIVKAFDVGSTVAPRYGDGQAKFSFDLNRSHSIALIGFWGDDHNAPDRETGRENDMPYYGRQDFASGTVGLTWRALWGKTAVSRTSVSSTGRSFNEDWYETSTGSYQIRNRSLERSMAFRNVNHARLTDGLSLEFGADIKSLVSDYDNGYQGTTNALGDTVPPVRFDTRLSGFQYGLFVTMVCRPASRFTVETGLRADRFTANRSRTVSPRASISMAFNERTTIKAAMGLFQQNLPTLLLAQNSSLRTEPNPRAFHAVIGFERMVTENTRLTVEVYRKDYSRLPADPSRPGLNVFDSKTSEWTGNLEDNGRAESHGIEIMVQKKLASKVYGLTSATWFRARYRGADGKWRNRDYDNRLALSAEGGYKPNRNWEFSLRWIVAGGVPYTPLDLQSSKRLHRAVLDGTRINAVRYPDYLSINVRFDRRFNFRNTNLIFYLSVWNATNHKNVAQYFWNDGEQKQDVVYQWLMLPVFGLEYEF
jgi:hypothetical protein